MTNNDEPAFKKKTVNKRVNKETSLQTWGWKSLGFTDRGGSFLGFHVATDLHSPL